MNIFCQIVDQFINNRGPKYIYIYHFKFIFPDIESDLKNKQL